MKLFTRFCYTLSLICVFVVGHCSAEAEKRAHKIKEINVVESVPYTTPVIRSSSVYIAEHFDSVQEFNRKWMLSKAKKPDVSEDLAQYNGKWDLLPLEKFPLKGDAGLVLVTESRHAAIVSKFNRPFIFDGKKKFIVQYVVTFQKTVDCGGAYLKLLTDGALKDLSLFNDKTPYTIMFGPDKCGGVSKMHFIIRHKNPINGTVVEKHCTKLKVDDAMYKDQEPYLLKLVIEPDNNFAMYINNELQYKGNLLDEETFNPPINPPKEIVDESDVKPADWDDRPKIADPDAVKPEDWDEDEPAEIVDVNASKPEGWLEDESATVPDEDATKPQDWDEEMDGEWEPPIIENPLCKDAPGCGLWSAPMIENPKFKGKWKAPMIDNPEYKGKWVPKKIPNPEYYYDETPLKSTPIGYIGFELWSLVNNMYFDDILVTDSESVSNEWIEKTWTLKKKSIAAESASVYRLFLEYTNTYPWLWAAYVLILAVIVGVVGTCCLRWRKNKDDFEKDALHKKSDDYQTDDELSRPGQSGAGDDELASADAKVSGDGAADEDEETDPEEKNSKPSSEDEDDCSKDKTGEKETVVSSSPRKRKPRRD